MLALNVSMYHPHGTPSVLLLGSQCSTRFFRMQAFVNP